MMAEEKTIFLISVLEKRFNNNKQNETATKSIASKSSWSWGTEKDRSTMIRCE